MTFAQNSWSVGTADVQGRSIVYKFIDSTSPPSTREKLPWLTAISWAYDGTENDGMPPAEVNQAMIALEDALETIGNEDELYIHTYSATGNNLKEFVFYIADRELFMERFNEALQNHPRYPIEIQFYEDPQWSDLAKLHQGFGVMS